MNQFLSILNDHRKSVVRLREAEQLREQLGTVSMPMVRELHKRFAETEPGALAVIEKADDPLTRSVLILRYVEGLKWQDVASQLGSSSTTGSVKMMTRRFLQQLDEQSKTASP